MFKMTDAEKFAWTLVQNYRLNSSDAETLVMNARNGMIKEDLLCMAKKLHESYGKSKLRGNYTGD